jgi:hypothetical protein
MNVPCPLEVRGFDFTSLQSGLRSSAYYVPVAAAERRRQQGQHHLQRISSGRTLSSTAIPVPLPSDAAGKAGAEPAAAEPAQPAAAELARSSAGAASDASRSSGSGSTAGAALLNPPRKARSPAASASKRAPLGASLAGWFTRQVSSASAEAAAAGAAAADGGPPPPAEPFQQRLQRWLHRFVVRPLFGYDPSLQGEWAPPDGFSARWAPSTAKLARPALEPLILRLAPGTPVHAQPRC